MDIKDYIISHTTGNLYWKNLKGKYLGCNQTFCKLAGLRSPANIIGKTDVDLFLASLGKEGVKAIVDVDKTVIESGKPHIVKEVGLNKDGKLVTYISKKMPLRDKANKIIGIIGTSIDISDFIDIKDYIISHSAGNLYWKDRYGRYLGCNEAFANVLKLSSPNDIVGKNDYDFFLEKKYVKRIIEIDQAVINSGKEVTLEEVGTGLDGNLATYLTKKSPLRDEHNNIIGLMGTSLDITKQKQAEIAKLEFLRNMSHDIRTPLVGVLGMAGVLQEEETDPIRQSCFKDLVTSSERLLQLLNQVIEVIEVGAKPVCYAAFNIKEVAAETVELLKAAFTLKKLTLKLNCPDVNVTHDKFRISAILLNLLSNAIKFTERGSITVTVKAKPKLKIIVEDSGIGIPKDKLDVIFEKFTKLAPSHNYQQFSGAGIGLFITKQYANELGGNITVASEFGKGSVFCFE